MNQRAASALILAGLLAACQPRLSPPIPETITLPPAITTPVPAATTRVSAAATIVPVSITAAPPSATITPTATSTPTSPPQTELPYTACGFVWAAQALPELSAELQATAEQSGLSGITITAEAFGENCLRPDGSVDRFLAMQTDFRLTVPVKDLADDNGLADRLAEALPVVLQVPQERLSGPNPGRVQVQFTSGSEVRYVYVQVAQAREALQADPSGANLPGYWTP